MQNTSKEIFPVNESFACNRLDFKDADLRMRRLVEICD